MNATAEGREEDLRALVWTLTGSATQLAPYMESARMLRVKIMLADPTERAVRLTGEVTESATQTSWYCGSTFRLLAGQTLAVTVI